MNRIGFPVCACLLATLVTSVRIERTFDVGDGRLQRFVVRDSRVFVGGVDALFVLDTDLTQLASAVTGPIPDNLDCTLLREPRCTDVPLVDTSNSNRVLLPLNDDVILACGSVLQGTCQLRNATTLTVVQEFLSPTVEDAFALPTDDDEYQTLAMLVDGPVCMSGSVLPLQTQQVLFKAMSERHLSDRRNNLVTEISFAASHLLPTAERDSLQLLNSVGGETMTNWFDRDPALDRVVRSVFEHDGFLYFVFVDVAAGLTSHIARVCTRDCRYDSYFDIPLTCSDNLVQDATFAHVGSDLAVQLGVDATEQVLVTSYRSADDINGYGSNSQICVFTMSEIQEKFIENIEVRAHSVSTILACAMLSMPVL